MYDIAVIGSGFGGSICAITLARLGYQVLLVEKGQLPRFAIGESTTPLTSKKLRFLGRTYGIPEFEQMSTYDSIKSNGLEFTCAPKELFHYFWQEPGQKDAIINGETREIIVQTPEIDTQLLRAESDLYLVKIACDNYGVTYWDNTNIDKIDFSADAATLYCERKSDLVEVQAKFVVDASGPKSVLTRDLNLAMPESEWGIPLRSRAIYTHFVDINRFEDVSNAPPEFVARSPEDRGRATQHHCFDGGWVWIIPFDNGVTSVGLNLDMDKYPLNNLTADEEFWQIIGQFPIIHGMIFGKEQKFPFIKTGRIQHRVTQAAGDRWIMLPGAAVGGDAWFSTGLAFTLMCIHRLVDTLHTNVFPQNKFEKVQFENYQTALFKEWKTSCTMINGIYKSFKHFDVFKHYCFFCFMGAETFIYKGSISRPHDPTALLLSAGDETFMHHFWQFYDLVLQLHEVESLNQDQRDFMRDFIQNTMKPYNFRDYGNPKYQGVHRRMPPPDKMSGIEANNLMLINTVSMAI